MMVILQKKFHRLDTPVIPETEFCVLLGNLLENALDACQTGRSESKTIIYPNSFSTISASNTTCFTWLTSI